MVRLSVYSSCLLRALCVCTWDLAPRPLCPRQTLLTARRAASKGAATCLKTFLPSWAQSAQIRSPQATAVSGRLCPSSLRSLDVATSQTDSLTNNSHRLGVYTVTVVTMGSVVTFKLWRLMHVCARRRKDGHVVRDSPISASHRCCYCCTFSVMALET